jgi:tetratricopeptide (TPR) repeat protein
MIASIVDSLPNHYRTMLVAAPIYHMFAPPEDASRILGNLNRLSINNSVRLANLGKVYQQIDSLNLAEKNYREAIKTDKANLTAILGLVSLALTTGGPQQALQFIESLDENIRNMPDIMKEKINLLKESGEYEKALALAKEFLGRGVHDIERYRLALDLTLTGDNSQEAENIIKTCLDDNPDNADAFVLCGRYHFLTGKIALADKEADGALAINSEYIDGYMLKAEIDTLQGKRKEAEAIYEKVLQIDKDFGPARGALAWLIADRMGDYQLATNYAMAALAAEPLNPMNYITLGYIYYRQAKFTHARGNFEKGLKHAPENPVVNYYVGLGYWKEGKPDKAREFLQKALALGLSGKLRTEAEATMNKL